MVVAADLAISRRPQRLAAGPLWQSQPENSLYPRSLLRCPLCDLRSLLRRAFGYHDTGAYMGGTQSAYIINYVMSVLFVFLYFDRPDSKGLSYGGAWTKMLGTAFISLANIPVWPQDPRCSPLSSSITSSPHVFFSTCFIFSS